MDTRSKRLDELFRVTLEGHPISAAQKDLFLEAVCSQADRVTCISEIIGNSGGLMSLKAALRYDLSPRFLNGHATRLLNYLQAPEVETIDNGRYLEKILSCIVESLWASLGSAFKNKMLRSEGERCFAWLLLRLVSPSNHKGVQFREIARDEYLQPLLCSQTFETRLLAQQINNVINNVTSANATEDIVGGHHDNDFVDFRQIAIMPTADEINSQEKPFLRTSSFFQDPETEDSRLSIYLDNQFRLLREEMLSDIREEVQGTTGKKKGQSRDLKVKGLDVLGAYFGPDADKRLCKWAIKFELHEDFPFLKNVELDDRRECLQDQHRVFSHRSLVCLLVDDEVVAFPTVFRDNDLLSLKPPILVLQFDGEFSTVKALSRFKSGREINVISIGTRTFAFEPVLKAIQAATDIPFSEELLFWKETSDTMPPSTLMNLSRISTLVCALESNPNEDLEPYLELPESVKLDASQANCFIAGLTQRVSLIQGPPGTGKSFLGALLAKTIYECTYERILVVCFTNHALDQFLEDLMDKVGIAEDDIVRLGSKPNARTAPLLLRNQMSNRDDPSHYRFGEDERTTIDILKSEAQDLRYQLDIAFNQYSSGTVSFVAIMKHLESEHPTFFTAFCVPESEDGMVRVAERGMAVDELYLLKRWSKGWDAGIFIHDPALDKLPAFWDMPLEKRRLLIAGWKEQILQEDLTRYCSLVRQYNEYVEDLDRMFSHRSATFLRHKRIIGCTTTGAAKYTDIIQAASPSVLIVEEAGEILESHVLTALGKRKRQLILIGDHQQLRPKVNNYALTVEKGDGYDLNMSMFERLILKLEYPHGTLSAQHRMRPEISALVRHLTYPDLVDAEKTKNRPNLKGIRDNIVFITHDHPEDDLGSLQFIDNPDTATSSKQNTYEARMVLKIVQYLGQQGYKPEDFVILTPYLGQLQKLQQVLKNDMYIDAVLNDLDSDDFFRAGISSPTTAQSNKKQIRIATIDNYQGEESDIVIASLTRSNSDNDIGFMASPQRVNVLLSRARNALIMIGNTTTFIKARKGKELWNKLFGLLKDGGHVYDGLPVRCERHQNRTADLKRPLDFEKECPNGGCTEPCGADLNCMLHKCPSSCHQLYDHSEVRCEKRVHSQCDKGHDNSYLCYKGPPHICRVCEKEQKRVEKVQKEAFALKQKRDQEQEEYDRKMAELDIRIKALMQNVHATQISQQEDGQEMADLQKAAGMATWSPPPPPSPSPETQSPLLDPRPHSARHSSVLSDQSPSPPGMQRSLDWRRNGSQVASDTGAPSARMRSQHPTSEWGRRPDPSYGSQATHYVSGAIWPQQRGSLRERSESEHEKLSWRRR